MYCKCNNSYNYQVVGLCDNISSYDTSKKDSWTQITVPEIITIPECYPDIESIERIYISSKVDSVKTIKTPVKASRGLAVPNEEGTLLSGRKLIVHGVICETIIYVADNKRQTLHSLNTKNPFCSYIVVPNDSEEIEVENYCVDVCIENVFAKALNSRVIFKNIALFLKAKKNKSKCIRKTKKGTKVIPVKDNCKGLSDK